MTEQPLRKPSLRIDRRLTAARAMGVAGGVIGLLFWFLALLSALVSGLLSMLEGGDLWLVLGAFLAAFVFPVLGVIGGAVARSKPKRATIQLGVASLGGLITLPTLWLFSGPFLVAGAVLAWLGRPRTSVGGRVVGGSTGSP